MIAPDTLPPQPLKCSLMETPDYIQRMRLVGGSLALDFVNTRGGQPRPSAEDEALHDYDDLVAWARYVGVVTDREARRLLGQARRDPDGAQDVYERAVEVRRYLYDLFRAVALGQPPPRRCIAALRSDEAEALARAELVGGDGGFAWSWAHDDDLARPLRPVIHAAVELLITAPPKQVNPLRRVKRCDGCQWLFIDESKNRSRRWCSMEDCGTDEKMRRYVARRAAARR
jgi:predicted RNA-binding Zn ribbon-like protein